MYEPAAFMEKAPMMFYALEDDFAYKVPVVFVHGIAGTPRDFAEMIERLDRRLYRPWLFFYPSGTSLSQLSEFFYRIFLSGSVVSLLPGMPMVIIAHSMGGLVVRDALNRHDRARGGPRSIYLVTIASPFGGMPGAAAAGSAPMTVPSWLDLAPHSVFLSHLHRSPLRRVEYDLIYTRGRPMMANGTAPDYDGVVPLASQLESTSRREAAHAIGFSLNHREVLSDEGVIAQLLERVGSVKPPFSEAQLAQLTRGGFAVSHPERYTPMERHVIQSAGYYLEALANSTLQPSDSAEAHFVDVLQKGLEPRNEAESAWLKFRDEKH
jgi:pimeloyl-ACP methyl ester carboxylesterase